MIIRIKRTAKSTREFKKAKGIKAVTPEEAKEIIERSPYPWINSEGKVSFDHKEWFTPEEALERGLMSREIYEQVKEEIEGTIVYPAITPLRKQFEEYELIQIDIKVSKKCFNEIINLFKFHKIPYKPIKEGIEVTYYPK